MRPRLLLTYSALLLGACFNPEAPADADTDASTGSGGTTEDPGSGTDGPATTDPVTDTDPDTTVSPTTTGVPDDPPTIELTINGSDSPGILSTSAMVPLEATVDDDGTVTAVDFYRDGELLGTVNDAPFTLEVLMTSIDSGDHEFTATATDDASQQTDSAPVSLTVDINGGGVVAIATNLFQTGGLVFQPGGGLVIDADGNVIIEASLSTNNFDVTGLGSLSLSPDLSDTNWQISVPASLVEGENQYLTTGQPFLSADGTQVFMGANNMGADGAIDPNVVLTRVSTDGMPQDFFETPADPNGQFVGVGGMAVDPDGNVFMHGPDESITKLDPATDTIIWQEPVGASWDISNLGGYRIRADDEGDIIFDWLNCDFTEDTCGLNTRKVRGFDGIEQWNEELELDTDFIFLHVGGSAPGPDGQVITVHGRSSIQGQGLRAVLRDDGGSTIQDFVLDEMGGSTYAVADIIFDAQGHVAIAGTRFINAEQEMREAFAMRFDTDGNLLWNRSLGFGMIDDQGLALTLDSEGHLFVLGFSDLQPEFVAFTGDLWVAELDL